MITVVVIRSLSYTGTTWINLLLGSHERAFALGPPDRLFHLLEAGVESGTEACRIHAGRCDFWPRFFASYDPSENPYVQIARASGADVVVLNNPTPGLPADEALHAPEIFRRDVHVVRDGRAVCASYSRYYPEADFYDAVTKWFLPSAATFPFDPDDPDKLTVNYEDVIADQRRFIERSGGLLGLEYAGNSHRFWEFEHHPVAGNAGTLGIVRRFRGVALPADRTTLREKNYRRLMEDPETPLLDERWKEELGERDRLVFDYFCGEINARWGYSRDRFTVSQVRELEKDIEESGSFSRSPAPSTPFLERHRLFARLRGHLEPKDIGILGLLLLVLMFLVFLAGYAL